MGDARGGSGRPNLVEVAGKYSVEMGRTGLVYVEGNRRMLIDSEVLVTPGMTIAVNAAHVRAWDPPHEGDLVTDEERQRILENIKQALDTRDCTLSISWPFNTRQPDGTWRRST